VVAHLIAELMKFLIAQGKQAYESKAFREVQLKTDDFTKCPKCSKRFTESYVYDRVEHYKRHWKKKHD
jgi:hypothetical protein